MDKIVYQTKTNYVHLTVSRRLTSENTSTVQFADEARNQVNNLALQMLPASDGLSNRQAHATATCQHLHNHSTEKGNLRGDPAYMKPDAVAITPMAKHSQTCVSSINQ
jgi:hypothetical protein